MSALKDLIRREITSRSRSLTGTVISAREVMLFDETAGPMWVADVDIGSNRPLRNVPIKAGANGERFYADLGQTVEVTQEANGRYYIVGPASRLSGFTKIREYDVATRTEVDDSWLGFSWEAEPFEFYKGPTPGTPGTSLWNDTVTSFPFRRLIDANGDPI